ncbi:MAG: hypothetical protein LBM67_03290 [Lentimicrobiaceae bacterium]|nr:hypothetical protein [Lentimicrobiaceae bacterium]
MKFLLFVSAFFLLQCSVLAQDAIWKNRKKYINIGYVEQTLMHKEVVGLEWESNFGVSLSFGRTYYLHKKPLFKMLKFGIDLTLPDITYAKYLEPLYYNSNHFDYKDLELDEEIDLGMHQIDAGIQVGPSITINPVDHLKISTYFRYAPSVSMIILDDELNSKFVSFFTFGGAIAYKVISLGVEARWGSANYKSFSVNPDLEFDDDGDVDFELFESDNNKLKTKSVRFYISFRF